MRLHACLALLAAFWSVACLAQEPAPTPAFTYTLQTEKDATERGDSVLTPDGSLLVLLPRKDNQWLLKRVSGWDTNAPRENTLALDGGIPAESRLPDHTNLTVSPGGDLLLVRLSFNWIDWTQLSRRTTGKGPDAVVFLIDLRTFAVVSRRVSNDPLIAASIWRFNQDGLLFADSLIEPHHVKFNSYDGPQDEGTYGEAAYTLPDLKPSVSCTYTKVNVRPNEPREAFFDRERKADEACAAVLKAGNVTKIQDLKSWIFNYQGFRIARKVNTEAIQRVDPNDPRYDPEEHCTYIDVGEGDRFADYRCELTELTPQRKFKMFYRAAEVFSVADGKRVLVLHVPPSQEVDTRIATSNGHDYLLVLREGINLEAYLLK
jgi:hypothetical protein